MMLHVLALERGDPAGRWSGQLGTSEIAASTSLRTSSAPGMERASRARPAQRLRSSSRTAALTRGTAGGETLSSRTPSPTRTGMASSSEAASPQMATSTRPSAASQTCWISRSTPGSRAIGQRRHGAVPAFGRERVLGQVVGADADEVDVRQQRLDLECGSGYLDHRAELQAFREAGRVPPRRSRSWRASIISAGVDTIGTMTPIGVAPRGVADRDQLVAQHLRMLEAEPDTPLPEEGVRLRRHRQVLRAACLRRRRGSAG